MWNPITSVSNQIGVNGDLGLPTELSHLKYHYYEHIVLDEVLGLIRKAEQNGYDAVVIGCFYDPVLREARELVKIPIVAPAEACMYVAAILGHKFSVIVGRKKSIPKMETMYIFTGSRKNWHLLGR